MLYAFSAAIVVIDQIVKYLIQANLEKGEVTDIIKNVIGLTHVHNTGGAFSVLREHTWILTAVSAVLSLVLVLLLAKKVISRPVQRWALAAVLGGAVGNLIDRLVLGYVVDMFKTLFMDFAVFNVADIFITVGGIIFLLDYMLEVSREDKTKKTAETAAEAEKTAEEPTDEPIEDDHE